MVRNWLSKVDSVGFLLSLLCAIHCLLFPLLIVVLPLLGMSFLLNAAAEKIFVLCSIAVAGFSLFLGYKVHKNFRALVFYFLGALALVFATFVVGHGHFHMDTHHAHEHTLSVAAEGEEVEAHPQSSLLGLILMVVGGVSIAAGHLLNKRFCHTCPVHPASEQPSSFKIKSFAD